MKSVKPGRGPSFMGGIGAAVVGVIGIGWTAMASSIGAPGFFTWFGVAFVVLALVDALYNFKNATGKNRFSAFDVTDANEEPDPLNAYFSGCGEEAGAKDAAAFCPFCGAQAEAGFRFCKKCGKELPQ